MHRYLKVVNCLYIPIQCIWGAFQTLPGLIMFSFHRKNKHFRYQKAYVTEWKCEYGLSLGMFIFLPANSEEKLLVHEYGHTVQSFLLGPLYLLIIGIPSIVWARIPYFELRRQKRKISYYSFYTESWADSWGGYATDVTTQTARK